MSLGECLDIEDLIYVKEIIRLVMIYTHKSDHYLYSEYVDDLIKEKYKELKQQGIKRKRKVNILDFNTHVNQLSFLELRHLYEVFNEVPNVDIFRDDFYKEAYLNMVIRLEEMKTLVVARSKYLDRLTLEDFIIFLSMTKKQTISASLGVDEEDISAETLYNKYHREPINIERKIKYE